MDVLVEEEVVVVGALWPVFRVDGEGRGVRGGELLGGGCGAGEDGLKLDVLTGLDGWLDIVRIILRLEIT